MCIYLRECQQLKYYIQNRKGKVMKDNFLKYKKIGLISFLVIIVISAVALYNVSGFKELNKNDTESIFIDEDNDKNIPISDKDTFTDDSLKENDTQNSNNISLKNKKITVEIKGQVKNPDVYILDEDSIINDLIILAGGITENAYLDNINRAQKLQDHEMIYIADKNEEDLLNLNNNSVECISEDASKSTVNINSATLEQLKTLNGIGESKAQNIIEYREKNGGFKSIDEIKNVTGIGEKMFEKIKESITI